MKSVLRGAVRDHRLPSDYKLALNQPMTTKRFLAEFKRHFMQRFITKQYATLPIFVFFGLAVPFFGFSSYMKVKQTGTLP